MKSILFESLDKAGLTFKYTRFKDPRRIAPGCPVWVAEIKLYLHGVLMPDDFMVTEMDDKYYNEDTLDDASVLSDLVNNTGWYFDLLHLLFPCEPGQEQKVKVPLSFFGLESDGTGCIILHKPTELADCKTPGMMIEAQNGDVYQGEDCRSCFYFDGTEIGSKIEDILWFFHTEYRRICRRMAKEEAEEELEREGC